LRIFLRCSLASLHPRRPTRIQGVEIKRKMNPLFVQSPVFGRRRRSRATSPPSSSTPATTPSPSRSRPPPTTRRPARSTTASRSRLHSRYLPRVKTRPWPLRWISPRRRRRRESCKGPGAMATRARPSKL
jgi:hypothetical protein